MGKLSPDKVETVETPVVAFTNAQIKTGLEKWAQNLITAKAENNEPDAKAARDSLDMWLDRKLKATG